MATLLLHPYRTNVSTLIDDEDIKKVNTFKWYLRNGYASTTFHKKGSSRTDKGRNINLSMHRLILDFPEGIVDHINRNRLDNRKDNLRIVTHKENIWNSIVSNGNGNGFIGVTMESTNCYVARLGNIIIGYYSTAELAAKARDIEALKIRGDYAVLNFSREELPEKIRKNPKHNVHERSSKVIGVSYSHTRQARNKWRAVWCKQHLGWFETEAEAIREIRIYNNEN